MSQLENKQDYSSLSYDELTTISRNDHQEDVRQYDKQQNALCLVSIGAIILICGIVFLLLSFVKRRNVTGIEFTSLPFIVSVACFVGSITLLTIGLIRFFKAHSVRMALKSEINEVTRLKTQMISKKEVGGF